MQQTFPVTYRCKQATEEKDTKEKIGKIRPKLLPHTICTRQFSFDLFALIGIVLTVYLFSLYAPISHANHAFLPNTPYTDTHIRREKKTSYSFALRALYWSTVFNKTFRYFAFGKPLFSSTCSMHYCSMLNAYAVVL